MGYLQDRDRRIAEFEEAFELCEKDFALVRAIWRTRMRIRCYAYKDGEEAGAIRRRNRMEKCMAALPLAWRNRLCKESGDFEVTRECTLEAVRRLRTAYPASRIAVLHIASGTNPGGGVIRGVEGQEESLCRCSTLYPCLQAKKARGQFYHRHQATGDPYYSDTCIYLPGIVGIRDDRQSGEWLEADGRYTFDVITCAPPNVHIRRWSEAHEWRNVPHWCAENIERVMERRVRAVVRTAIRNRVEVLVLGAFGCEIYGNAPEVVACAFKKALNECGYSFRAIVFAIPSESEDNYNAFSAIL